VSIAQCEKTIWDPGIGMFGVLFHMDLDELPHNSWHSDVCIKVEQRKTGYRWSCFRDPIIHHLWWSMAFFKALVLYSVLSFVDLALIDSGALGETELLALVVESFALLFLQLYKQSTWRGSTISEFGEWSQIEFECVWLVLPLELTLHIILHILFWRCSHRLRSRVITEQLVGWRYLSFDNILQDTNLQLLEDKQFREGRTVMSPFSE